jgi:hypothetical protein
VVFGRQATVVATLSVILAACSAGAQPTASTPGPDPSRGLSALAMVSPTPTTHVATPTPLATAMATPAATPGPTPNATGARVPPKPTGVTFRARDRCVSESCHRYKHTRTVTWESPLTKGVEIRVYGATECVARPAEPKPGTDGPCLVKHTRLPASGRTLLATAPASAGKVTWSWIDEGDPGCDLTIPIGTTPNGQNYYAVVVAAYSTSGHSIFAVAESGSWVEPDPESGDQFC